MNNKTTRTRAKIAALAVVAAASLSACFGSTSLVVNTNSCTGTKANYSVHVGANVDAPSTRWRVTSATGVSLPTTWQTSGAVLYGTGTLSGESRTIIVNIATNQGGITKQLTETAWNSCN